MEVRSLAIEAVKLVRPRSFGDARGYFMETWNRRTYAAVGIDVDFVQDNQSRSSAPITVGGLHFQTPPVAQAKLVRVLKGAIFNVASDLRRSSESFGQHISAVLTAEGRNMDGNHIGAAKRRVPLSTLPHRRSATPLLPSLSLAETPRRGT